MVKTKIAFVCSECGNDSPKWLGKCPVCDQWNTYKEKVVEKSVSLPVLMGLSRLNAFESTPILLQDVQSEYEVRMDMQDQEFNRVLGGGLVRGSLVLIGGEPGIGKSTLILQIILKLKYKTLYVSGEESAQQIKLRAERLKIQNKHCFIVCETYLEQILSHVNQIQPDLVVIDSIQTLFTERIDSSLGTISQIRESTSMLLKFAKETHTPLLIISHINKDGNIAGPKILEHMVDTVLQFEGDRNYMYRILRNVKNRFGSTAEVGIYEMKHNGLREVNNPSELLLVQNREELSGMAIASAVEGIRPFLIEIQALVSTAAYGTPQRSTTGFEIRRMNMLLAVLEKKAGFKLSQKDVFLNIAGGLRMSDPAIDLSVISAILSSNLDVSVEQKICMCGEVGLSGEIRPIYKIEPRILEAEKLGFQKIIVPANNLKGFHSRHLQIAIKPIKKVEEIFRELFG